ncbi:NDMA-dependent alcohol dehydrogenase [Gordonia humi]|uniref:alcohol dehydrogenase n=1 Tax=Gordonia humi TaxID=686429 RepID=A0A840ETL2_9ACTN|nr:NDMA-dependent alcohol dehydrogenase [Gordonia humi]MBB4133698.1 S-(hydroxymethyl)glutathione dehydrogenase/alcohol dehydrogenase [Gordonia humi]
MKTDAAILWGVGEKWSVEEIELAPPREGEVLVRYAASGLCHSDDHCRTGDIPATAPTVGGHEGAGVVEEVGPGVTTLKPGDHVVAAFIPACGRCRWCANGQSNLCDLGAFIMAGSMPDGTYRRRARGRDVGALALLGTFSEYATVLEASLVKIDDDIPLDMAALVGCGVTTGWGSAVNSAKVGPGDTVVVIGCGGIGTGAIQGARLAGAEHIVAVDPAESKNDAMKVMGATHFVTGIEEAQALVGDLTRGVGADSAILTPGVLRGEMIAPAMDLVRKGGTGVATAISPAGDIDVKLSLFVLTMFQKKLVGSLFGECNPRADIPRLLRLYQEGQLKLDEMVTREYALKDVNTGYDDMLAAKNIRGMIRF